MATATTTQPNLYAGETLHNVAWETYCTLRDEEANNHVRMIYLDGELTIMSPHIAHDLNSRIFLFVIAAVARASRIEFLPVGTTTLKKRGRGPIKGVGKEPDEGFYLRENVARMHNKKVLDLKVDPPPDLAFEIDNTVNTEKAIATYARIGVPEVWRFDIADETLWFGRLEGNRYQAIDRSLGLPRLTPALFMQALEVYREGLSFNDWLDWLDAWARNLPEPA
jgi:Uma2 family endonuclease